MKEANGFHPTSSLRDLPQTRPRMTIEGVSLTENGERLLVLPIIPALWQIPPRRSRPPAVHLTPGQWIRWQLNYRFSSATGRSDWTYHLHTLNLAYGPTEAGAFLRTPTHYVDERGNPR